MKQYIYALLVGMILISCNQLSAKIRLLTFHYNKPDFIEMQDLTLKKFMSEDYELIVFNDGNTHERVTAIQETCDRLGIQCIRFEESWHVSNPLNQHLVNCLLTPGVHSHVGFNMHPNNDPIVHNQPSVRHSHVIQYALDHFGYTHDDIVVILDGDAFPIRPIDLRSMMNVNQILGIYKYIAEQDVGYFWVPFVAMDMPTLPNKDDLRFHVDLIGEYIYDTGAHSYHYINNNPDIFLKKYSWLGSTCHHHKSKSQLTRMGFTSDEAFLIRNLPWPNCVEFHIDKHFLHFGASSFSLEGHDVKSDHVKDFLIKITQ